jgi:hypothetical protein
MNIKVKLSCILIIVSRFVDLFSTYFSVVDFKSQETNVLVKILKLSFWEFCIIDILLAALLVIVYLYSIKSSDQFKINSSNLFSYSKMFIYKKEFLSTSEYMFSMSFNRIVVLFGTIIPIYIFLTSLIFSLNNFWVYLYIVNNDFAVSSYRLFNSYCFFDFIIFVLPIFILIFLLHRKLKSKYYLYNILHK